MTKVVINLVGKIKSCNGKELFLPNGVDVYQDGRIIVADGGNNRICILNKTGDTLRAIGEKGFSKYKFKEPVGVFVSPDQKAYVADWHNHRIVIYDSKLYYAGEYGHLGTVSNSRNASIREIVAYLKAIYSRGSYRRSHFTGSSNINVKERKSQLKLFYEAIRDRINHHGGIISWFRYTTHKSHSINKPNGVAFADNKVVITQKNNRCLSVYENKRPFKLLRHILGPCAGIQYGRLGNIHYSKPYYYVCDERQNIIWKLNSDFELADQIGGYSSDTPENLFMPFSCCMVSENLLAVCGGKNFQIIDTEDKRVVFVSEPLGELHGIAYNPESQKIYMVDRYNDAVLVYDIQITEKSNEHKL